MRMVVACAVAVLAVVGSAGPLPGRVRVGTALARVLAL